MTNIGNDKLSHHPQTCTNKIHRKPGIPYYMAPLETHNTILYKILHILLKIYNCYIQHTYKHTNSGLLIYYLQYMNVMHHQYMGQIYVDTFNKLDNYLY